eukprot:TRINITY_DN25553_c0_g1_i1.p1 TRINITY_DN25553_c0_g1~~TRINITY_DN25553_c0_g1_i1.p1  ORF type:complete len:103 (+),score=26.63 TRINITY_DN25553_c0_g1_i1:182-490(+)
MCIRDSISTVAVPHDCWRLWCQQPATCITCIALIQVDQVATRGIRNTLLPQTEPSVCLVSDQVVLHIEHLSLIHISEPTRLLSISYAVFCLKKKKKPKKISE